MKSPAVLSLVEHGWMSARTLSVALAQDTSLQITHYIRGRLNPAIQRMITPYPRMQLRSVARTWFRPMWWCVFLGGLLTGHWRLVVVDNMKTYRAIVPIARWRRVPVIVAQERWRQLSYRWGAERLSGAQVVQRVVGRAA